MADRRVCFWQGILGVLVIAVAAALIVQTAGLVGTGRKAPPFTLRDLAGKAVSLDRTVKSHQVTLVNFWATWCPPCRQEVPELVSFYKEFKERGVLVLAVDIQESAGGVRSFAAAKGMSFPVLLDTNGKIADLYGISGIPTTIILDRRGLVRHVIVGGTTKSALRAKTLALLGRR